MLIKVEPRGVKDFNFDYSGRNFIFACGFTWFQCLHQLKPSKAMAEDKIFPAIIKVASEPLSTPLSAINNIFKYNIFLSL